MHLNHTSLQATASSNSYPSVIGCILVLIKHILMSDSRSLNNTQHLNIASVMTGLRRMDSLAARCLLSRGRNKRAMVSRQKQEYQRQSRDVNNTRQGSRSQAQVQSSKVGQSGVNTEMAGRITLRMLARGKQDFALGECLCAAFM